MSSKLMSVINVKYTPLAANTQKNIVMSIVSLARAVSVLGVTSVLCPVSVIVVSVISVVIASIVDC